MASVKEFYKKKLLAAKDIKGQKIKGEVTDVYPETRTKKGENDETKLIVELSDGDYRISLNKSNALALAKQGGDDYDEWKGKQLEVSTIKTSFNGVACDGLSVRFTGK